MSIRLTSISIAQDATNVVVNAPAVDLTNAVQYGYELMVEGLSLPLTIVSGGNSTLEIAPEDAPASAVTNAAAKIIRTKGALQSAIEKLEAATTVLSGVKDGVSAAATPDSVAKRTSGGQVIGAAPTADNHLVNRGYLGTAAQKNSSDFWETTKLPILDSSANHIAPYFKGGFTSKPRDEFRHARLYEVDAANPNSNGVTADILVRLPQSSIENAMVRIIVDISDGYGNKSVLEVGGYARAGTDQDWTNEFGRVLQGDATVSVTSVDFGYADNGPCLIVKSGNAGVWGAYPSATITRVELNWSGADDAKWLNPKNYSIEFTSTPPVLTAEKSISTASGLPEILTSETLNFDEFEAIGGGDVVGAAKCYAENSTDVVVEIQLLRKTAPSGIAQTGTFTLVNYDGTVAKSGVVFTFDGKSSPSTLVLNYSGISGYTPGHPFQLRGSAGAKIKVND